MCRALLVTLSKGDVRNAWLPCVEAIHWILGLETGLQERLSSIQELVAQWSRLRNISMLV